MVQSFKKTQKSTKCLTPEMEKDNNIFQNYFIIGLILLVIIVISINIAICFN